MHSIKAGNGDGGWGPVAWCTAAGWAGTYKLLFSECTFCGLRKILHMLNIKVPFLFKIKKTYIIRR